MWPDILISGASAYPTDIRIWGLGTLVVLGVSSQRLPHHRYSAGVAELATTHPGNPVRHEYSRYKESPTISTRLGGDRFCRAFMVYRRVFGPPNGGGALSPERFGGGRIISLANIKSGEFGRPLSSSPGSVEYSQVRP